MTTVPYVSNFDYAHLPQDEDIGPEGRTYTITEEILDYKGRKILCLRAQAGSITFCDRSYLPCIESMNVKGYIKKWKYKTNEIGEAVTELEPIDVKDEEVVKGIIKDRYNISNVYFLSW